VRIEAEIGERYGAGTVSVPAVGNEAASLVPFRIETRHLDDDVEQGSGGGDHHLVQEDLQEAHQLFIDVVSVDRDLFDERFDR
jgi:hypothetical protein